MDCPYKNKPVCATGTCPGLPNANGCPVPVPGAPGPAGPPGESASCNPCAVQPVDPTTVPYNSELNITTDGPGATHLFQRQVSAAQTVYLVRFDEINAVLGGTDYITVKNNVFFHTVRESAYSFRLTVTASFSDLGGGAQIAAAAIWNATTNEIIALVELVNNVPVVINVVNVNLPANSDIALVVTGITTPARIARIRVCGNIQASDFPALLYAHSVEANSSFFRYLPDRPNDAFLDNPELFAPQFPKGHVFPYLTAIIPHSLNQVIAPPTLQIPPSAQFPTSNSAPNDRYDKANSVPSSIYDYLGIAPDLPNTDPLYSIFLKNYENRGPDNYLKKIYKAALTTDVLPAYKQKITAFINKFRMRVMVLKEPVLSAFARELIEFFLTVHVGVDEKTNKHPPNVVEYFAGFTRVIGFGDPCRAGRNEAIVFGNDNVRSVRDYFSERNNIVAQTNDRSCIIYYWALAGLSPASLVMESIHNIIAFNQFLNVIWLIINDQYGTGTLQPPGVLKRYDFFDRYAEAGNDEVLKLNITREVYRLLVPNTASFSKVIQATDGTSVPAVPVNELSPAQLEQEHVNYDYSVPCLPVDPTVDILNSRHVHKSIQYLTSLAMGIDFATYNPNHYSTLFGLNFDTTLTSDLPGPHLIQPDGGVVDPSTLFFTSPYNNESVIQKINPKVQVVYPLPFYVPFGFGYRDCPGQGLSLDITQVILEACKYDIYEFRQPADDYPSIPRAPFTDAPDNIFFVGLKAVPASAASVETAGVASFDASKLKPATK